MEGLKDPQTGLNIKRMIPAGCPASASIRIGDHLIVSLKLLVH